MTTAIDTAMGSAKEAICSASYAAKGAADDAAEAVKGTADDASRRAKKLVSFLTHLDMDDVLGLVGLRRRRSPFVAMALVGGGILVGAGITLLLAPESGRDARKQIRKLFETFTMKAKEEAQEVKDKAQDVKDDVKSKAGKIADDVKDKVQEAKDKVGEIVGQAGESEVAQAEDTGDERKARRRNHNAQVS